MSVPPSTSTQLEQESLATELEGTTPSVASAARPRSISDTSVKSNFELPVSPSSTNQLGQENSTVGLEGTTPSVSRAAAQPRSTATATLNRQHSSVRSNSEMYRSTLTNQLEQEMLAIDLDDSTLSASVAAILRSIFTMKIQHSSRKTNSVMAGSPSSTSKQLEQESSAAKLEDTAQSTSPGALLRSTSKIRRRGPAKLKLKPKFLNTLPNVPMDAKFLRIPSFLKKAHKYIHTPLKKISNRESQYQVSMGHHGVNLVDTDLLDTFPDAVEDEEDVKIFEGVEEFLNKLDKDGCPKRSAFHAKNVSWLRRTEYISTEQMRFKSLAIDNVETKVGFLLKKQENLLTDFRYMGREGRVEAIEKTFTDSAKPITTHFSKPGVYPLEVLPVFPDFKYWKYSSTHVVFDKDPAPPEMSKEQQEEAMSDGLIRGILDENGEHYVAYFLPTLKTLEKRKADKEDGREYEEDGVYDYKLAREYIWKVKDKGMRSFDLHHFFVVREDGVYYNELDTKVVLTKRKPKKGKLAEYENMKMYVTHVPLTEEEYRSQAFREKDLEPKEEESDEDEEDKASDGRRSATSEFPNASEVMSEDEEDKASDGEQSATSEFPNASEVMSEDETDKASDGGRSATSEFPKASEVMIENEADGASDGDGRSATSENRHQEESMSEDEVDKASDGEHSATSEFPNPNTSELMSEDEAEKDSDGARTDCSDDSL